MKHYLVMIDNDVSSKAFTFDELLDYGLLDDYDEHIKVKATEDTSWYVAREYPFHISERANPDYVVNEDGTVTRRKSAVSTRIGNSSESPHNTGNNSSQTSNGATSNAPSSKSEEGDGCIWAIIITIGIIILYSFLK